MDCKVLMEGYEVFKEWMKECESGQKNFLKMREDLANHSIEKVVKKLRDLMPWIGKNKLVDKSNN